MPKKILDVFSVLLVFIGGLFFISACISEHTNTFLVAIYSVCAAIYIEFINPK